MLYNPLWSQPEQKFGTIQHFAAWLSSQPGDTTYQWRSVSDCLVCRYAQAFGKAKSDGSGVYGAAICAISDSASVLEAFLIPHAANLAQRGADGEATYAGAFAELLKEADAKFLEHRGPHPAFRALKELANAVQS